MRRRRPSSAARLTRGSRAGALPAAEATTADISSDAASSSIVTGAAMLTASIASGR